MGTGFQLVSLSCIIRVVYASENDHRKERRLANVETAFYRDTWAEIDLDAVRHNVRRTKGHLEDNVKLFAVVKANAYGHGDAEVARAALEAGADFLAVAFLDEAITLRKKGIDAPILILGAVRFSDAGLAADYGLAVTVYDHEWLASAAPYLDGKRALAVHLKCDTGMGRLGFRKVEELAKAEDYMLTITLSRTARLPRLQVS